MKMDSEGRNQNAPSAASCGGCGYLGEGMRYRGHVRDVVTHPIGYNSEFTMAQGKWTTWSRLAIWSVLLVLLNTITRTEQSTTTTSTAVTTTTPTPTVTIQPPCFIVFEAKNREDVFDGACQDITSFPCTSQTNLQTANPSGDCSRYFQCDNLIIRDCPCSEGTKFNVTQGTCVRSFFASCTCPDGRGPTRAPLPGPDNTSLIVGVVVGLLVIIILVIVIVLILRKKKQEAQRMEPSIVPQTSVKSTTYDVITDFHRGDDEAVYDNGPTINTATYDNHGFADKDAIRAREENATVRSTSSTISPPPVPAGHPSMRSTLEPEAEEPEYMQTLE